MIKYFKEKYGLRFASCDDSLDWKVTFPSWKVWKIAEDIFWYQDITKDIIFWLFTITTTKAKDLTEEQKAEQRKDIEEIICKQL